MKAPIRQHLLDPADEASLQQAWRRVRARRGAPRRRWWPAGAALAAATAAAAGLLVSPPARLEHEDGRSLRVEERLAPGGEWRLSDGSRVTSARESELLVLKNERGRLELELQRGSVSLDVRSRGRTAWRIGCGWASVEITGTRLSIVRAPEWVEVSVEEGTVQVTSAELSPPVRRLTAGGSLRVPHPAPLTWPIGQESPTPRAPERAPREPALRARGQGGALPRGAPSPASTTTAAPSAAAAPPAAAPDLFAEADAARRAGDPRRAAELLTRLAQTERGARGGLAAFTLGRLLQEELASPAEAAGAFRQAMERPLPAALAESARARLVTALGAAGQRDQARAAAAEYLRLHPAGQHRAEVEAWR